MSKNSSESCEVMQWPLVTNIASPTKSQTSSGYSDDQRMVYYGKRQQFRRNLSLISVVGLTSSLMLTWEASFSLIEPFLEYGGPSGVIAAYPIVVLGVLLQVLVMAEIASMIPLSGGSYNWVAVLSPPAWANFLSYITGWVTVMAWQAATASTFLLCARIIQTLAILNYSDYNAQRWHVTLIFFAVVAVALFFTTYLGRLFPTFEAVVLVLYIVSFFVFLIIIVYLSPIADASDVFQSFQNDAGFSTNGQAVLIGAEYIMFAFIGIDAATHVAEEIENASVVIPRSMIISVLLNGGLGFGMLIAILFCMGSVDQVLNGDLPIAFIGIFQRTTNSAAGATALTIIHVVVSIASTAGCLAASSRVLWAFAREDGVPGSEYLARIHPRTGLPIWSIAACALGNLLLALINLGSKAAFNALTNLSVSSFYSIFVISATVMLYKRLTTPANEIFWGPFRLGQAGVPITIAALVYSVVGWLFSFWPASAPVNVASFNWSIVVYFGSIGIAILWWVVRARQTYRGPKMELPDQLK